MGTVALSSVGWLITFRTTLKISQAAPPTTSSSISHRTAIAKRDQRSPLEAGQDDIFERHVDDGDRNQRLDEQREPQGIRHEVVGRRDQRDRMRDRKRSDHHDERSEPTKRDDQAKKEQQVIGSVENVLKSQPNEAQRCLVPGRSSLTIPASPTNSNARTTPWLSMARTKKKGRTSVRLGPSSLIADVLCG